MTFIILLICGGLAINASLKGKLPKGILKVYPRPVVKIPVQSSGAQSQQQANK